MSSGRFTAVNGPASVGAGVAPDDGPPPAAEAMDVNPDRDRDPDHPPQPEVLPHGTHSQWQPRSVKTAKCDMCERRNGNVIQQCVKCRVNVCRPCFDDRQFSSDSRHHYPDSTTLSWSPVDRRGGGGGGARGVRRPGRPRGSGRGARTRGRGRGATTPNDNNDTPDRGGPAAEAFSPLVVESPSPLAAGRRGDTFATAQAAEVLMMMSGASAGEAAAARAAFEVQQSSQQPQHQQHQRQHRQPPQPTAASESSSLFAPPNVPLAMRSVYGTTSELSGGHTATPPPSSSRGRDFWQRGGERRRARGGGLRRVRFAESERREESESVRNDDDDEGNARSPSSAASASLFVRHADANQASPSSPGIAAAHAAFVVEHAPPHPPQIAADSHNHHLRQEYVRAAMAMNPNCAPVVYVHPSSRPRVDPFSQYNHQASYTGYPSWLRPSYQQPTSHPYDHPQHAFHQPQPQPAPTVVDAQAQEYAARTGGANLPPSHHQHHSHPHPRFFHVKEGFAPVAQMASFDMASPRPVSAGLAVEGGGGAASSFSPQYHPPPRTFFAPAVHHASLHAVAAGPAPAAASPHPRGPSPIFASTTPTAAAPPPLPEDRHREPLVGEPVAGEKRAFAALDSADESAVSTSAFSEAARDGWDEAPRRRRRRLDHQMARDVDRQDHRRLTSDDDDNDDDDGGDARHHAQAAYSNTAGGRMVPPPRPTPVVAAGGGGGGGGGGEGGGSGGGMGGGDFAFGPAAWDAAHEDLVARAMIPGEAEQRQQQQPRQQHHQQQDGRVGAPMSRPAPTAQQQQQQQQAEERDVAMQAAQRAVQQLRSERRQQQAVADAMGWEREYLVRTSPHQQPQRFQHPAAAAHHPPPQPWAVDAASQAARQQQHHRMQQQQHQQQKQQHQQQQHRPSQPPPTPSTQPSGRTPLPDGPRAAHHRHERYRPPQQQAPPPSTRQLAGMAVAEMERRRGEEGEEWQEGQEDGMGETGGEVHVEKGNVEKHAGKTTGGEQLTE